MNQATIPTSGLHRYQSANSTPVRAVMPIAAYNALTIELHQHAHNALATAAWHIARGDAPQALTRLRRAQSHILASMEGGNHLDQSTTTQKT
ncbi:hypothetical protein LHU53_12375 [Rhodoferax sp. U2-2l]|uniref:hypothetical protein n=1 Tax=Rhodoferax sp. U2-2l TaxID=2884000 RepID=UPI001D0AFACF|nr:hypothetical protein [Rhodoferax sp. U2-2l]MCB8747700.1 hypothetical protein [Rhodoferax sp. U2-2l]